VLGGFGSSAGAPATKRSVLELGGEQLVAEA
jgi:hypothetical protein